MRKDVALAREQFAVSERRACKLLGVDRGSYRYEPRPDRNTSLREALVTLARQKPRYGYRRLHALLTRREHPASVMRIYRLYRAEGLAVRRLRRKRLSRVAVASHVVRSNQEWALDFACDTLATGRGIRVLAVGRCVYPRKPFLRSRHELIQSSSDTVLRRRHRTSGKTRSHSV
jgi:putative transposase